MCEQPIAARDSERTEHPKPKHRIAPVAAGVGTAQQAKAVPLAPWSEVAMLVYVVASAVSAVKAGVR